MKKRKNLILALVVILALAAGCVTTSSPSAILDLNSTSSEFEVTFSADGKTAVFASNRDGGQGGNDIYTSQLVGKNWETPVNIGPAINTSADEQEASLSADGQTLYFIRVISPLPADLYISRKVDGVWQPAESWNDFPELPHVNSPEGEEHCPIIVSKDLIYFSYNYPGVTQDSDIYQIRRVNGVWGKPEPLPGQINSPYRDHLHWTCLSQDGNALIFVSERPDGSQGGSDQWISYKDSTGNWSAPVNLGLPVNTAGPEICWTFTPDGEYFVGASDRPNSQGGLDIYRIKRSSIPLLRNFKPRAEPPLNLLQ